MTGALAAWYSRFPEGWWGYHWAPPQPMSAVELDRHARPRRPPDGDAVGGRQPPPQRHAQLGGTAGRQDDRALRAGRLPPRRHDRHLRPRLVGGVRLARRDRAGHGLPARQRDERPPADLRLGPGRARRADAGRQGLGDGGDDARRLAARGARAAAHRARRDRCGPRRPDDLPAVLGIPHAGRHVPTRRGGVAPAPGRDGGAGAGSPRRDRGRPIAEPHRRPARSLRRRCSQATAAAPRDRSSTTRRRTRSWPAASACAADALETELAARSAFLEALAERGICDPPSVAIALRDYPDLPEAEEPSP